MKKYILLLIIAFLSVHLLAQTRISLTLLIPVLTLWVLPLTPVVVVWEMWVRLQIRT